MMVLVLVLVLRAFKYRIYPNKAQKILFAKTFGCCRWVWNQCLEKCEDSYKKGEKSSVYSVIDSFSKELPIFKKQPKTEWLKEAISSSLIHVLRHQKEAWCKFFKYRRNVSKGIFSDVEVKQPKYKARHNRQSFSFHQGYSLEDISKGKITIPKCKNLKIKYHRPIPEGAVTKTCTVTMEPSGKYYISILAHVEQSIPEKPEIREDTTIGVHCGVKDFITTDENIVLVDVNRFYRKYEKKLAYLQRKLSRKQEKWKKVPEHSRPAKKANGRFERSKRWIKLNRKIAKLHEKIRLCRENLHHNLSASMVKNGEYDTICVENYGIQKMMQDKKKFKGKARRSLNKGVSDVAWGNFLNQVRYKGDWNGKNTIQLKKSEPVAKRCSSCGHINEWVELRHRKWTCENCGEEHKREHNCAKNAKQLGLSSE